MNSAQLDCGSDALRPVAPAEPPAAWLGGKSRLAKRICAILASNPHTAYVEPFVGMGGVFLRRTLAPKVEVINDLNGEIVNLFRVLQRYPDVLARELRWRPAMRAEFERFKNTDPATMLDVERAARFLYLQRLAFGGRVDGSLGVSPSSPQNFNLSKLLPRIDALRDRLGGVIIECLTWSDVIPRYDRPGTVFYLDPPYWGGEDDYGKGLFSRDEYERMSVALRAIDGRFLLSINDTPEIRRIFSWADMTEVSVRYSIGDNDQVAPELLISKGLNMGEIEPHPSLF